ncbi:MAG TPA: HAD-IIIA family hydrolase [Trebonia sp.]|nr:HAD-IIIA family hydrolase [Trebonia sp.]
MVKEPGYVVVIPTLGRASLQACVESLAAALSEGGCPPRQVVLADDRRDTPDPLPVTLPPVLADRALVVTLEGRGPAAARNAGWRAATATEWVVFLDDDVVVSRDWARLLASDLGEAGPRVGGVQGVVAVPWPAGRRPADSQRATLGLAGAQWITADMAYRRTALVDAGGFDERFPRAYREDSDLALRVTDLGWTLRRGQRRSSHPVRPPSSWASLRAQAGNADDAAMRHQHGAGWQRRAGASAGRRATHVVTCALGASAVLLGTARAAAALADTARAAPADTAGRSRAAGWPAAALAMAWAALTSEFAVRRIMAGPRTWSEIGAMAATSALIPPLAVGHWLAGTWRNRNAGPWPPRPAAVLFDRDGTLVRDVPYNGDPDLVEAMPGAAEAVAALRQAGLRVGVVSNQSGVGTGRITLAQVSAVNQRVAELIGPLDTWQVCPHDPREGCGCRKPQPGLVLAAADELGVPAPDCVVIGDIAADVAAARAAGACGIVVPTAATRTEELAGVPCAANLTEAVAAVLAGRLPPSWPGPREAGAFPGKPCDAGAGEAGAGEAGARVYTSQGSGQDADQVPAGGGDRRRRVSRAAGLSAPA